MTEHDITRRGALRLGIAATSALTVGVGSAAAGKGNDSGNSFGTVWANDTLYATNVVKPLDERPANEDRLYFVHDGSRGLQSAVSETAPGDTDYNGGKWTHFNALVTDMQAYEAAKPLTNAAEVLGASFLTVELGRPDFDGAPPNYFLCPLTGRADE